MKRIVILLVSLLVSIALEGQVLQTSNQNLAGNSIGSSVSESQNSSSKGLRLGNSSKPKVFVENNGQIVDEGGQQHREILFTTRSNGTQAYLGQSGIYYVFKNTELDDAGYAKAGTQKSLDVKEVSPRSMRTTSRRFEVRLVNSNPHATVVKSEPDPYFERYYLPHCPQGIKAHSYNKVVYKDIYKGIDWVLYSNVDGHMKYEFVVHPGADPHQIQLRIIGAGSRINADGRLVMTTELGSVEEAAPVSFTGKGAVVSHFVQTKDGQVGFEIEHYDTSKNLVIDPVVSWSTYYGGNSSETGADLATDASGNVYLTGLTSSLNFPVSNAVQATPGGAAEAYLAKFSSTGTVLWATFYGGSGIDWGNGCATDASGNVYMTGSTASTNFPLSNAVQSSYGGGGYDAYVVKFTSSGTVLFATYYGGSNEDWGSSCTTDANGNLFVTGYTVSSNFQVSNAAQGSYAGGTNYGDAFITKFGSTGSVSWASFFGGTSDDRAWKCATDAAGNVYFVGTTLSPNLPISNAVQSSRSGSSIDAFIAKFSSTGSKLWATYFGGGSNDEAFGCATDASGNIYVSGYTYSSNFPSSNAAYSFGGGISDAFISKLSTSGALLWSTFYGGNGSDVAYQCAVDTSGVYVTGDANSTNLPVSNAIQGTYGGSIDAFVIHLSKSGSVVWASYFGSSGGEVGRGAAMDVFGSLYISGNTSSTTFPVSNAAQSTLAGGADAFLVKFNGLCPTPVHITASPGDTVCAGTNVTFTATVTNGGASPVYQWKKNGVNVGTNNATYSTAALANGDIITCTLTSSLPCAGISITSAPDTMTVLATVTPTVAIVASPGNSVCTGAGVSFSATSGNGGTSPTYQWKKNGVNVGASSPVYVDSGLLSGDVISCVMTSSATCPNPLSATSNSITMVPGTTLIPSVSITTPRISICKNALASFTAVPTNGGSAPTYQWKKNGLNVGTNDTTYSDPNLANGDTITIIMTSNEACVAAALNPAIAPGIVMNVNPLVVPGINVNTIPPNTQCAGVPIQFVTNITGGGNSPSYQWYKNGLSIAGATQTSYTDSTLLNTDTITAKLTSTAVCPSMPFVFSNKVGITTLPLVTTSVSIAASPAGNVSPGTSITFTSSETGGGPSPRYQWRKNSTDIPFATSSSYTSSSLLNGDVISLTMTSSDPCPSSMITTSNPIVVDMTPAGLTTNPTISLGQVRLYPNPNNGHFTITGVLPAMAIGQRIGIDIYNSIGQRVYHSIVQPNQANWTQDVWLNEELARGTYLLRLAINGTTSQALPIILAY